MERIENSINTVTAKNRFNELINQIQITKKPLVVKKRGEAVAVLLDYQTYQENMMQKNGEASKILLKDIEALHRRLNKKYPKGTGDSLEILEKIRKNRIAA